jgi:hypothetical protein
MSDVFLAERLAHPGSRNDALEELERVEGGRADLDGRVLAQVSSIIRQPQSVTDIGKFASLLVDLDAEDFIPPLVEMISADPDCGSEYTSSYMYALGCILDASEYAGEHPEEFFPSSFVAQLGRWLLNTAGGELSWKAGIVLDNIRIPHAFELMRQGAADTSLFFQTRIHCIHGLVNGLGVSELPFLDSLIGDPEPMFHEAVADAIAFLREQKP